MRRNNTLKASPLFLGWSFVFLVPITPKCCFAFVKERTACVLVQDRAKSTRYGVVAFARPSGHGQTVTQREDPYSTSTNVDSFKLLFKITCGSSLCAASCLVEIKVFFGKKKKK